MECKYYVYRHYIGDNTFYVGKGSNNRAYDKSVRNSKWKKFTKNESFDIEIVKYFKNEKDAFDYEAKLTQYYKKLGQCQANVVIGTRNWDGKNHSEETKKKMSKSHTGKTFSDEHKKKISEAHAGKTLSYEHKKKLREKNLGENNPMYGKTFKHSSETKTKISNKLIGENNPRAKKIILSINNTIYTTNCKKDMSNILKEKYEMSDTRFLHKGNVPKKYKHIIDYIIVEDELIYKK